MTEKVDSQYLGAAAKFRQIDRVLDRDDKWLEKMNIEMCAENIINADFYANLTEKEKAIKFMMFGFGLMKIFNNSNDDVRCLSLPQEAVRGVIIATKIDEFLSNDDNDTEKEL